MALVRSVVRLCVVKDIVVVHRTAGATASLRLRARGRGERGLVGHVVDRPRPERLYNCRSLSFLVVVVELKLVGGFKLDELGWY